MIEGYIIEGTSFIAGNERPYDITSDIVFTSLSDALEEGRNTFEKYFDFISDPAFYPDGGNQIDEKYFDEDNMVFYSHNIRGYYVEVTIRKVSIKLGNKKLEETNND